MIGKRVQFQGWASFFSIIENLLIKWPNENLVFYKNVSSFTVVVVVVLLKCKIWKQLDAIDLYGVFKIVICLKEYHTVTACL